MKSRRRERGNWKKREGEGKKEWKNTRNENGNNDGKVRQRGEERK